MRKILIFPNKRAHNFKWHILHPHWHTWERERVCVCVSTYIMPTSRIGKTASSLSINFTDLSTHGLTYTEG